METPAETQPYPEQTLLGAALIRSRVCRAVGAPLAPLEAHGEAIVELLGDIAATLRELPLATEGKQNSEDARRYRLLKEHWPKDWSVGFRDNGTVFIVPRASSLSAPKLADGDTLDAALDALMPRM